MPSLIAGFKKIEYERFGDPANPCLILISGLSSQLINWPKAILAGLVSKGFYVLVFDNRDVGLSHYYDHLKMPNFAEILEIKRQGGSFVPPYTLDEMAEDVLALMNALAIPQAHIAGMSMGGMIAQLMAIHYPERCLSLSCIATSSGNPNLPPPSPAVLELTVNPGPPATDLESYLKIRLQSYKVYNHPIDVNDDEARQFLQAAYLRAYHPEGNTRQLLAVMAAAARTEKLKALKLPSLIFHGNYDPVFPLEHAEELAAAIPQSELVVIDKLGHALPERMRVELVESLARFRWV